MPSPASPHPSRRSLLGLSGAALGAAALGVGADLGHPAAASAATATPDAAAAARGRADAESPRFTVVVLPDTQYLFDGDSLHPDPLSASVDWVAKNVATENIAFVAHLGDVVQNAATGEFAAAAPVLRRLDRTGVPWSVLAGNHDIDGSTDDQRGSSPWLDAFGPARLGRRAGVTWSPDGYNSAHRFRAGGRDWMVLALDWRLSPAGLAWASSTIAAQPAVPVILTTHELVDAPASGAEAVLSDYGRTLWDGFVSRHDQIFLSVNGHFWPTARTVATNAADHDVQLHLANYQDRFWGGAAMLRLYRFDLERNSVDVSTIDPYFQSRPYASLDELSRDEIELTTDTDRFQFDLDPAVRFAGFAPTPPRAPRSAAQVTIPGTLALWGRFGSGADGAAVTTLPDLTGAKNDLRASGRTASGPAAITWSPDHHPDAPSRGSIRFQGGMTAGDYLATVAGAPLAAATLERGFTIETFFKLPADWSTYWSSALTRRGSAGSAGKHDGYSDDEPIAGISFSNLTEVQWNQYPQNLGGSITNWSHLLDLDTWYHLAIVSDGRRTTLWIEGCLEIRNPATIARGIATTGKGWLLGGHEDADVPTSIHVGWIGDTRITGRALRPEEFLNA